MEQVAAEAGITKLIVYRHFDSKDDLYRAVLERVSTRLVEEFMVGIRDGRGRGRGMAARALLAVAREDQHAFALLMRHAIREEPFADYIDAFHLQAVTLARSLVTAELTDAGIVDWAAETVVAHMTDAVLLWVERGDPARDGEFVAMVTAGMIALVGAWGSALSG